MKLSKLNLTTNIWYSPAVLTAFNDFWKVSIFFLQLTELQLKEVSEGDNLLYLANCRAGVTAFYHAPYSENITDPLYLCSYFWVILIWCTMAIIAHLIALNHLRVSLVLNKHSKTEVSKSLWIHQYIYLGFSLIITANETN